MSKQLREMRMLPDYPDKRCSECMALNSSERIKCLKCESNTFQSVFAGFTLIPKEQNFNRPSTLRKSRWTDRAF